MKTPLVTVLCLPLVANAAVYRCLENGRPVFQSAPCPGEGAEVNLKPASGPAPETKAGPDPGTAALVEQVAVMSAERRKREIGDKIKDLEINIRQQERAMEAELAVLRAKKAYAKNNLAGATWEQSISTEMQVVSDKYKVKTDNLKDRITALQREADGLK